LCLKMDKNGLWNGFTFLGNGTLRNGNPDTPSRTYSIYIYA
jgi:hypothetical protein